ncbi:MAG: outer membrane beta-barrel protein [Chitinophagaceae bacterium]
MKDSLFLTPYAVYDKYKTKAGNHDITETGFTFGVRMESYLNRSNNKNANQPISPWPKKGASFIEYNTSASYGFSTRKEYQGNIRFGDVKRNNTTIGLGYHYYFLDFLAGGLNISYTRTSSNNGSPDIRKTFTVQPTVTANLPVETSLKNLFLQAGYELLKANNTGTKEDGHSIYLRLGYNLFLAKNISLTPKIGYQNNKSTHHTSGSDVPYNDNGLAAELGIRAWLNTTNWFKK